MVLGRGFERSGLHEEAGREASAVEAMDGRERRESRLRELANSAETKPIISFFKSSPLITYVVAGWVLANSDLQGSSPARKETKTQRFSERILSRKLKTPSLPSSISLRALWKKPMSYSPLPRASRIGLVPS